jgi:ABC-type thiamine transport system substrate-binding protein
MKKLRNYLTEHLRDANWTYWQHLSHSLVQCRKLAAITFKGFVHGFIPWVWPGYAPIEIYRMYKEMKKLRHVRRRYDEEDARESKQPNV